MFVQPVDLLPPCLLLLETCAPVAATRVCFVLAVVDQRLVLELVLRFLALETVKRLELS